jgi:hypothetical protein
MASIVERLTEGVVNRDMRAESNALLAKGARTGLLEGLTKARKKASMARLLENQAKELLRESSSLAAGDVEGFAAVAFPIVRRVFAGLIANDLVSVQPMSLPSGLIFFLDFVYSPNLGESETFTQRMGNLANKSIYGGNEVGAQITGGINLVDTVTTQGENGLRQKVGYAYASPSGSLNAIVTAGATALVQKATFLLNGAVSDANKKLIRFDPDLLAIEDSGLQVYVLDVAKTAITANEGDPDFDNLSAFVLANADRTGGATTDTSALETLLGISLGVNGEKIEQIRRLSYLVSDEGGSAFRSGLTDQAEALRLVLVTNDATVLAGSTGTQGNMTAFSMTFPVKDQIDASATVGAVVGDLFALEGSAQIPEIDIKVDSIAVTAQTKKLKAKWTPELGQDLNAYHNLDAETELTSILSEQIALEIDREILADLVEGATASVFYWSRSPGLFVNRETGLELGASTAAPDFTGTVSEWYETLIETINDVSAQIHRKTLRGGANFVVCGPEVANILEFTAGFRASVTADAETGSIGAVNVGQLSKKFDVIVDPYFLRNVILVGRRGTSFLESGYVYAPYVPLQTTPTIFGPEDFVPRKGVMTRYAKKMVRPDMYGLVICRGLLGEEYAS